MLKAEIPLVVYGNLDTFALPIRGESGHPSRIVGRNAVEPCLGTLQGGTCIPIGNAQSKDVCPHDR